MDSALGGIYSTNGIVPTPEPSSVFLVVAAAVLLPLGLHRVIEPVAGTRGVTLRSDEFCSAQILGHRLAFEQVMANLLDNAIKFSHAVGKVVVRAVPAGD